MVVVCVVVILLPTTGCRRSGSCRFGSFLRRVPCACRFGACRFRALLVRSGSCSRFGSSSLVCASSSVCRAGSGRFELVVRAGSDRFSFVTRFNAVLARTADTLQTACSCPPQSTTFQHMPEGTLPHCQELGSYEQGGRAVGILLWLYVTVCVASGG